jgi:hypothetical protein
MGRVGEARRANIPVILVVKYVGLHTIIAMPVKFDSQGGDVVSEKRIKSPSRDDMRSSWYPKLHILLGVLVLFYPINLERWEGALIVLLIDGIFLPGNRRVAWLDRGVDG